MLLYFAVRSTPLHSLPSTELPIVVLICSYNNAEWVADNLNSVFSQNYTNYRILYVDDCSSDTTVDRVRSYAKQHNKEHKITLIANSERCRKMKNMYNAVHSCNDDEIIVQLDGDDWFCDTELFSHINHLYQTRDIWLTYGSYMDVPGNIRGYAEATSDRIIREKTYRKEPWLYMPTRTFYAWLFKQIELKDFIAEQVKNYQSLFFPSADDPAFMFPMLEMSGTRFHYIDHISYVANRNNPLIGRSYEPTLQNACGCDVRQREPYKTLLQAQESHTHSTTTNMLIFVENILNLSYLLDSIKQYAHGLNTICLVHDPELEVQINQFITTYPLSLQVCTLAEFVSCTYNLNGDYLLIATDTVSLIKDLDISLYTSHLKKTGAYGFYFAFSYSTPPFNAQEGQPRVWAQSVYKDVYTWKFNCGLTALFNNLDMTLLRAKDVYKQLSCLNHEKCMNISELKKEWAMANSADLHQVGLFLKEKIMSGTYQINSKPIKLPVCFELPEGRGYRSPADLERKRTRKKRLEEKRAQPNYGQLSHERRIKKRTLPLS